MGGVSVKVKRKRGKKSNKSQIRKKQDEFLDVYSLYLATGLPYIKEEAITKAYELHTLDSNFTTEI